MNISHVEDKDIKVPESNILQAIFDHQAALHKKYMPVEEKNGIGFALVKDRPFSLDDRFWQYLIKDMTWRVVEELTEASEARAECNFDHYIEELIDALHFYTELLIVVDISAKDIKSGYKDTNHIMSSDIISEPYPIIYLLGIACNLLKNKPWKNTHLQTDSTRFNLNLINGYKHLLRLLSYAGLDQSKDLYLLYAKKNTVNQFRIRSNY